jgi:S-adenosylmethionine:tRNA ribosyltransferase-isomerase
MHSEEAEVSAAAAAEISSTRAAGGRIVNVGTTVVRVLETVAAVAKQSAALQLLIPWKGATQLFIRPPYEFLATDALLTNFHFPRTTLLLLVQAFGGSDLIRRAYDTAIAEQYRFYSYGDAMLIT